MMPTVKGRGIAANFSGLPGSWRGESGISNFYLLYAQNNSRKDKDVEDPLKTGMNKGKSRTLIESKESVGSNGGIPRDVKPSRRVCRSHPLALGVVACQSTRGELGDVPCRHLKPTAGIRGPSTDIHFFS